MPAPTHINELPTEILHLIASHFNSLSHAWDLAVLSLVSRRWRTIAQEALLITPTFDIMHIHEYMLQLLYHPETCPRVRTLEIRSKAKRQIISLNGERMDRYAPIRTSDAILRHNDFVYSCNGVIEHFSKSKRDQKNWILALSEDCLPALLGILICILPNLKEFKCGNGRLLDFALLTMSTQKKSHLWPPRLGVDYLSAPLEMFGKQIEVLEMPANMAGTIFIPQGSALFDFTGFASLKDLGLSYPMLCGFPALYRMLPNPKTIFPPTLEVLRISEGFYHVADFLNSLCLEKKRGTFPALRRIEVFFMNSIESAVSLARDTRCLDPVLHLPRITADAEVELYMYFPAHTLHTWEIGGTPWRLKQEGSEVLRVSEGQAYTKIGYTPSQGYALAGMATDMEWERDGDVVMK